MPFSPRNSQIAVLFVMLLVAGWTAVARAGSHQVGRPATAHKSAGTDGVIGRAVRIAAALLCKSGELPCPEDTPR